MERRCKSRRSVSLALCVVAIGTNESAFRNKMIWLLGFDSPVNTWPPHLCNRESFYLGNNRNRS